MARLDLSQVRLQKCSDFVWLVLVPERNGASEVTDLSPLDYSQLNQEILKVIKVMQATFQHDKINIGALGNVVSQLHVHIIARTKNDPHWPAPVWGKSYDSNEVTILKWVNDLSLALDKT